jgi:hypothetical protein
MRNRDFDNIQRLQRDLYQVERYRQLYRNVPQAGHLERALRQATEARNRQLQTLAKLPVMDQRRLQSMLAPTQQAMKQGLQRIVATLQPKIDVGKLLPRVPLIPKLPKLTDMIDLQSLLRKAAEAAQRAAEMMVEGDEALEASGFGFADHLWNWGFVASFAHIDPRVRDAVVTNRLAAVTRSEEFESWLEEEFTGSPVLSHRWEIVRQAVEAHRRKEYLISIPALLAQVEGVIGDALISKNRAVTDGRKLYRLGEDGRLDLNIKNKPVELRGLTELMNHSDFSEYEALEDALSFFTDSLIPWRHAILHGRNTSYGKAKLSVQALLILLLFAMELRAFEEDRPPSAPAPYRLLRRLPKGPGNGRE